MAGDGLRRGRRAIRLAASGIGACLALAACSSTSNSSSNPMAEFEPALSTSLVTGSGTWALVPMGHLSDPTNTFWELFYRPATTTKWSLVTPPGVADNGGMVLAKAYGQSDGRLLVGLEPSQLLGFSPLAATVDGGRNWAPGTLPVRLTAQPSAMAETEAGRIAAIARSGGGVLYESEGNLNLWAATTTRAALAGSAAGRLCGVSSLTAASVAGGSDILVGAACEMGGVVGVFYRPSGATGAWQLVGPRLGAPLAKAPTKVLAMTEVPSGGTIGLVAVANGTIVSILAIGRNDPGASWAVSLPLDVAAGSTLVSQGFFGSRPFVLERRSDGALELETTQPGGTWQSVSGLPKGTETVVDSPATGLEALSVQTSKLVDYRQDPSTGTWMPVQVIVVPIPYGSSG